MKNVLFIVVLYQTRPTESTTLVSLAGCSFDEIAPQFAIWDNSPSGFGVDSLPPLPGRVFYTRSAINERLSRVYNKCIATHDDCDWIVILDDDSEVNRAYLNSLSAFFGSRAMVAVPRIVHLGTMISPGRMSGVRGRLLTNIDRFRGEIFSRHVVAMMSGSVINRKVFASGVDFDERLSFYGVDTRFFIDFSRQFDRLFVLDCEMPHRSALRERGNARTHLKRYRNLMDSWPVVFEDVTFKSVRLLVYMTIFVLKLAVVRRDARFIVLLQAIPRMLAGAADA